MNEFELPPFYERPPASQIFERIYGQKWDSLPNIRAENILPIVNTFFAASGPKLWLPVREAVKSGYGYDVRINFPERLDKATMVMALDQAYDVQRDVPLSAIKDLLNDDELPGEAAVRPITWWNPDITLGTAVADIVGVKAKSGQPRALIIHHAGPKAPPKKERRVFDLLPKGPLLQPSPGAI